MDNKEIVLVTGGSGAVAINCIAQLLQKSYQVRTTVRSLDRQSGVIKMLEAGGISNPKGQLTFYEADLMDDRNWAEAMQGCSYVLHVASPTHIESDDKEALAGPAVAGVRRVLKAARDAGVKRVVLTSSFGALGFSNKDRNRQTTEADWTDPNEHGLSAYERSKILAERAAWEFMDQEVTNIQKEGAQMQLAVINPVAIFGPVLGPVNSPSFGLLKMLFNEKMKAIPNIPLNVVDIRDVADIHIRAMLAPAAAGQRFIASADDEISMLEIANLLQVRKKVIPNWVLGIAGLFNRQAKHAAYFMKISRNVSNAKAKQLLGWTPVSNNEQAVKAAAESMKKFGAIK